MIMKINQEVDMKRSILIVFLLLTALVVLHAGGRAEADTEELSGTVSLTVDDDGYITALLNSEGVEYKLNIPQDELVAMGLEEGQELTVSGVLVGKSDVSPDRIVVVSVTEEGVTTIIKEPESLTLRERLRIRLNDGDNEPEKLKAEEQNRTRTEAEESSNPDAERTRTEGEKD
jgi:hypothetical protein